MYLHIIIISLIARWFHQLVKLFCTFTSYLCVRLGSFSMFLFHHLSTLNALLPELQRAASTFICERCVWSVSAVSCRLVFVHGTVTTCRLWSGGHSQWSLVGQLLLWRTHRFAMTQWRRGRSQTLPDTPSRLCSIVAATPVTWPFNFTVISTRSTCAPGDVWRNHFRL